MSSLTSVEDVETQAPPRLIQAVLKRRGFTSKAAITKFINPDYALDLHDPFQLTDMDKAVERIEQAIKLGQKVAVYGDYDIDGLTATTLLTEWLRALGLEVVPYIPDRFEEGYGINQAALEQLKKGGSKLVISVDCGITAVKEAAWAKAAGLDLIITDHHAVPVELPDALAVINPKRADDGYPFKDLAGVGVAFKLAQALQQKLGRPEKGQEKWLLDLVALGTVCDCVNLMGENRALAKYGLIVLNKTRRVGLKALAEVASVAPGTLSSYHLGFVLGPRLNAAGRLEAATTSLDLLLTADEKAAKQLALKLDELNQARRADQDRIFAEADKLAENYADDPVLVLADAGWSHGIVGIVASKLMEKWRKPALVLQIMDASTKGSGRSLGGFNLIDNLKALPVPFTKLGGHMYAAGFTLPTDQIDALRTALVERFTAEDLAEDRQEKWRPEARDLTELDQALYDFLQRMEPFGTGNPKPEFIVRKLKLVTASLVGNGQKHLKVRLCDEGGRTIEGIAFGVGADSSYKPGQKVEVRGFLSHNDFGGRNQLELVITGIK